MKLKKKLNSFAYTLKLANSSRKRIEELYAKRLLKQNDINQIYKGLYINSVVALERLIEDIFVGLLCKKYTIKGVKPLVTFTSYKHCFEILSGGKNKYIDWLPYTKTIELSLLYFKEGGLFNSITSTEKDSLELLSKIRNFMAHGSARSKDVYLKHLKERMAHIPTNYNDPVVYLRDFYSYPTHTYYEQLFSNILISVNKLITPPV